MKKSVFLFVFILLLLSFTAVIFAMSCNCPYAVLKTLLSYGQRNYKSPGIYKTRNYLKSIAQKNGLPIVSDSFTAQTPFGNVDMENISVLLKGRQSKRRIILAAHYETKIFKDFEFVGANDNAAGVAVLCHLMNTLPRNKYAFDVEFLFLDGEEAFVDWGDKDSLYGSRHYAAGNLENVKAFILLDMIGQYNLKLDHDLYSSERLYEILKRAAKNTGCESFIGDGATYIEDDHLPFLEKGVESIDIISFSYPYWHTKDDTLDKISPESLDGIVKIVIAMLDILDSDFLIAF